MVGDNPSTDHCIHFFQIKTYKWYVYLSIYISIKYLCIYVSLSLSLSLSLFFSFFFYTSMADLVFFQQGGERCLTRTQLREKTEKGVAQHSVSLMKTVCNFKTTFGCQKKAFWLRIYHVTLCECVCLTRILFTAVFIQLLHLLCILNSFCHECLQKCLVCLVHFPSNFLCFKEMSWLLAAQYVQNLLSSIPKEGCAVIGIQKPKKHPLNTRKSTWSFKLLLKATYSMEWY